MLFKLSIFIFFFLALYFRVNTSLPEIKKENNFHFSKITKTIAGNFNKSLASSIWIKTILDSDDHHQKKSESPWEYYRFELISDLDPFFFENYEFSPLFLSVVRNHPPSASVLFEKGIHYFPNKTNLNLFAAYHFLSEEKNEKKAYEILERINETQDLNSMATSIYYSLKSKKVNKEVLSREILKRVKDPILRKFLLKRINK